MTVYSIYVCRFNLFLFSSQFILAIIALPVYSLLQCRSERVISVMFVSIPPPHYHLSGTHRKQFVMVPIQSVCCHSVIDFFLFNFFPSSLRAAADRMVMATAGEGHSRRCAPR